MEQEEFIQYILELKQSIAELAEEITISIENGDELHKEIAILASKITEHIEGNLTWGVNKPCPICGGKTFLSADNKTHASGNIVCYSKECDGRSPNMKFTIHNVGVKAN